LSESASFCTIVGARSCPTADDEVLLQACNVSVYAFQIKAKLCTRLCVYEGGLFPQPAVVHINIYPYKQVCELIRRHDIVSKRYPAVRGCIYTYIHVYAPAGYFCMNCFVLSAYFLLRTSGIQDYLQRTSTLLQHKSHSCKQYEPCLQESLRLLQQSQLNTINRIVPYALSSGVWSLSCDLKLMYRRSDRMK
jgi:hypothetical protein